MKKKNEKLPGDIARIVKKVGSTNILVSITDASNKEIEKLTLTRDQFNQYMKCAVISFKDSSKNGFYTYDNKTQVAKLFHPLTISNDKFIKLNEHIFEVRPELKGWVYG